MQRDDGAAKVKTGELALDSLMSKYGKKPSGDVVRVASVRLSVVTL